MVSIYVMRFYRCFLLKWKEIYKLGAKEIVETFKRTGNQVILLYFFLQFISDQLISLLRKYVA